jgi:glycosyltransferase involved in cell wall biosynthesis
VKSWHPNAVFSPTWYDPAFIDGNGSHENPHAVLWVGRLETPKDPELAVNCFVRLVLDDDDAPWSLHLLGSGTRATCLRQLIESLPEKVRSRVHLHGRVPPEAVASHMANAGVFLLTSHPGYEGYPRVLVEAMASGLPAVVTEGSDTGNLVANGSTGYVCNRDPDTLSAHIREASRLDRSTVRSAVAKFDAPTLVGRIFSN